MKITSAFVLSIIRWRCCFLSLLIRLLVLYDINSDDNVFKLFGRFFISPSNLC